MKMSFANKIKEKILNYSNSYVFYKNNYYTLKNNIEEYENLLDEKEKELKKEKFFLDKINSIQNENKILQENFQNESKIIQENINGITNNLHEKTNIINENIKKINDKSNVINEEISSLKNLSKINTNILKQTINDSDTNQQYNNKILQNKITKFNSDIIKTTKSTKISQESIIEQININSQKIISDIDLVKEESIEIKSNVKTVKDKYTNVKTVKDKCNDINTNVKTVKDKCNDINTNVEIIGDINNSINILRTGFNTLKVGMDNYYDELLINKEISYALIFRDTISNSQWLNKKNFSLINGAANYSFMYLLFRILDEIHPQSILELGLGQTTKMTTQYIKFYDDVYLRVIENSQNWIDSFLENNKVPNNIIITQVDLENFKINSKDNLKYKNLEKIVENQKYDFIIIDGPQGWLPTSPISLQEYPRSNIWDLVENNLAEDFIILLDDYDRIGEQNTFKILKKELNKHEKEYNTFIMGGLKKQAVIFTKKFDFIKWF